MSEFTRTKSWNIGAKAKGNTRHTYKKHSRIAVPYFLLAIIYNLGDTRHGDLAVVVCRDTPTRPPLLAPYDCSWTKMVGNSMKKGPREREIDVSRQFLTKLHILYMQYKRTFARGTARLYCSCSWRFAYFVGLLVYSQLLLAFHLLCRVRVTYRTW